MGRVAFDLKVIEYNKEPQQFLEVKVICVVNTNEQVYQQCDEVVEAIAQQQLQVSSTVSGNNSCFSRLSLPK